MNFFSKIGYSFRKYPFLRTILILFLIVLSFLISVLSTNIEKKQPHIKILNPSTALPGDIITIHGENFGHDRGSSYVEFSGSRLTASSYISWNDEVIKIQIPQNVEDGLVYVITKGGKSDAKIFANKIDIPVQVKHDSQTTTPVILSIKELSAKVGQIITLNGKNFGLTRGSSQVIFPSPIQESDTDNYISCNDANYDYDFWSDQEIRVRVPDGATSGKIYILTEKGESNKQNFNIDISSGTKQFSDKRIYLLALQADISDIIAQSESSISIRVPKPQITTTQRNVEVTLSVPEPVIPDYAGTIVHQFLVKKNMQKKISIAHNFVVQTCAVNTNIKPQKIDQLSEKSKQIYASYLVANQIIPSNDEAIIKLAKQIIAKETNPYYIAQKLYNYMISEFTVLQNTRKSEDISELLEKKVGDAYDFTILFCAMARSCGIPAIPLSGILIDAGLTNQNHWWLEIYLENFGWMPVDVALGAGKKHEAFRHITKNADFYFGNLDSQHVIFSRGWNNIKPATSNSKTVYIPKTFAMQSIWEESSPEIQKYSSFWSNIQVLGIY
ncbi:MAG: hypothetical protein GX220_00635 [Treponema sp.]|mgnify:CR=1 FL=1|nr:hypothetical protein [Treponema sp.]